VNQGRKAPPQAEPRPRSRPLSPKRLRAIYRRNFSETPRERLFLASLAFFFTFGTVRLIAHAIRAGVGPFHDLSAGQTHIHHLVWGILLLLAVGYGWLVQIGTGEARSSIIVSRLTALLYGAGAALTLDEFALWLHLRDVYWAREGRTSVDAALLFGALISAGFWGGPFFRAVSREARKLFRAR
jgi:hypothetical protein